LFLNRDPIEEQGGLNLYGFGGNDAINGYDYLGYSWFSSALKKLGNWIANKAVPIIVATVAAVVTFVVTDGNWQAAGNVFDAVYRAVPGRSSASGGTGPSGTRSPLVMNYSGYGPQDGYWKQVGSNMSDYSYGVLKGIFVDLPVGIWETAKLLGRMNDPVWQAQTAAAVGIYATDDVYRRQVNGAIAQQARDAVGSQEAIMQNLGRLGGAVIGAKGLGELGEIGTVSRDGIKPGQVASPAPKGRRVGGKGEGVRPVDPPAGYREAGAFDLTPDNLARMEKGRPPIGRDGKPVELHHRGQSPEGPLDEMTSRTHDTIDHPERPSRIDRTEFAGERARYWRQRARELLGQE